MEDIRRLPEIYERLIYSLERDISKVFDISPPFQSIESFDGELFIPTHKADVYTVHCTGDFSNIKHDISYRAFQYLITLTAIYWEQEDMDYIDPENPEDEDLLHESKCLEYLNDELMNKMKDELSEEEQSAVLKILG